jgi:FKBP-type peptidyl-prolyl cis-trans isomerase (trigger factor)
LGKAYDQRSEKAFDEQLTDAMINHVNPEFPPSMAESYLGHMVEDVIKNNPAATDKEKVKEIYQPVAERNLKWYLIRNTIIKNEEYEITKEDAQADIDQRKEANPKEAKELEKYFKKPSNRSRLEDDLMEKKVLAYLKNFTKIKEVKVNTKDLRKQSEGNVQS